MRFVLALLIIALVTWSFWPNPNTAEQFYRDGKFEQSFTAFAELEPEIDDENRAPLYFNSTLAALGAGDLVAAEVALEKSDVWGDSDFEELRSFLVGNIEYSKCLKAELLSKRVEAGLPAFDSAVAAGDRARHAWEESILMVPEWKKAKRNLERVLSKLDSLKKRRQEFVDKSKKNSSPKDNPADKKYGNKKEEKKKEFEEQIDPNLRALMTDEVGQILDLIKQKEAQKKSLRKKNRSQTTTSQGRDW